MFSKSSLIFIFSASSILNGCSIGLRKSDIARAQKIEPTYQERIVAEGQTLTDILGVFIAQQTGLSSSLALTITNGSTINYIHRDMDKIEKFKGEENQLKERLFILDKKLNKLKIEYKTLQKALNELTNISESKRIELKQLNNHYSENIEKINNRLTNIESDIKASNKIINKQTLLNQVKEYRNEINKL
jgi:chromosome segregation ATPase